MSWRSDVVEDYILASVKAEEGKGERACFCNAEHPAGTRKIKGTVVLFCGSVSPSAKWG